MSPAKDLFRATPPATVGIISVCCVVYLAQVVSNLQLQHFTLCPRLILYLNEYYRIVTSALFHGNCMHLAMNMASTWAISSRLEKRTGTVYHIMATLLAILMTGAVYMGYSVLLYFLFGYDKLLFQHAVGFSGVIFHMAVLECNIDPQNSRSLFGFFSVPSYLYPWVL